MNKATMMRLRVLKAQYDAIIESLTSNLPKEAKE